MADLKLVWNQEQGRADWTIVGGALAAGDDLASAILFALFTDRLAAPDYVPPDGTGDLRGWWGDSLSGSTIGSRLWTLERRKIVNRTALAAEATAICNEALASLVTQGIARSIGVACSLPPAGPGGGGNLLVIALSVVEPSGRTRGLSYSLKLS